MKKMIMLAALVSGISGISHAATQTFNNPIYNGVPIDITPSNWDGNNESKANEDAANLLCEWQGFSYALSWETTQTGSLADHGTYRFDPNGGSPSYCSFCKWYFSKVRCVK